MTKITPIILVLILTSSGLFHDKQTVAQTKKKLLVDLIDLVTLGITKSEALKVFEEVEPKPKKITTNIYAVTEKTTNERGDEALIVGIFTFCSDKLVASQGLFLIKDEKLANDAFSEVKSEIQRTYSFGWEESCVTTDACMWKQPNLKYSVSLIKTLSPDKGVPVIQMTRRFDGLMDTPCLESIKKELPQAIKKLFGN